MSPQGQGSRQGGSSGQNDGGRGRGQNGGGRGRGMGGGRGMGPGGNCVCPGCGHKAPHQRGTPCFEVKCPQCGTYLTRE